MARIYMRASAKVGGEVTTSLAIITTCTIGYCWVKWTKTIFARSCDLEGCRWMC